MQYLELTDAYAKEVGPCEVLRLLQGTAGADEVQRATRGSNPISASEILQPDVHGESKGNGNASGGDVADQNSADCPKGPVVRAVPINGKLAAASPKPRQVRQQAGKHRDVVCGVPCSGTLGNGPETVFCVSKAVFRLVRTANRNALKAFGNAVVPQVAEVVGRAVISAHREITKS